MLWMYWERFFGLSAWPYYLPTNSKTSDLLPIE